MQIAQFVVMTMTVILVVTFGSQSAYAEQSFSFAQPDFIFKVGNIIEDIRLGFASGADKVELIKEFAQDKQERIDTALARGETVSLAVEERRLEILGDNKNWDYDKYPINSEETQNYLTIGVAKMQQIAELNEIRILYSQFDECTTTCTEIEKQEFNDKVNSLDSWSNKCSGTFDIHQYAFDDKSFDKLSQSCPDLNKYSKNHLITAITGKV